MMNFTEWLSFREAKAKLDRSDKESFLASKKRAEKDLSKSALKHIPGTNEDGKITDEKEYKKYWKNMRNKKD